MSMERLALGVAQRAGAHQSRPVRIVVPSPPSGGTDIIARVLAQDFSKAMGFHGKEPGSFWPGASGFRRAADGSIERTASAPFGEGDDFCATWHLFDLLEDGWNGWEPKEAYA